MSNNSTSFSFLNELGLPEDAVELIRKYLDILSDMLLKSLSRGIDNLGAVVFSEKYVLIIAPASYCGEHLDEDGGLGDICVRLNSIEGKEIAEIIIPFETLAFEKSLSAGQNIPTN